MMHLRYLFVYLIKDTENENAALTAEDGKILEKISTLLGLNLEELQRVRLFPQYYQNNFTSIGLGNNIYSTFLLFNSQ